MARINRLVAQSTKNVLAQFGSCVRYEVRPESLAAPLRGDRRILKLINRQEDFLDVGIPWVAEPLTHEAVKIRTRDFLQAVEEVPYQRHGTACHTGRESCTKP
jgi:hypothetical protein